ncbi:hypothetical protein LguiB_007466 [Lonicera macranthoides]
MADPSSANVILEFLRRNKFSRAEAALRSELSNRPELNGLLRNLAHEEKDAGELLEEENGTKQALESQGRSYLTGDEVSKELIVKEIECGAGRNGSESKWRNSASVSDRNKATQHVGTSDKNPAFSNSSGDTVLDLYSLKFNPSNGSVDPYQSDRVDSANNLPEVTYAGKASDVVGKEMNLSSEKRASSWLDNTSKSSVEQKNRRDQTSEPKELNQQRKISDAYSKDDFVDNPWSKSDDSNRSSSEPWKDCSVKPVFPFSKGDASTSYDSAIGSGGKKEGKRKVESNEIRAIKDQVDEVGRILYLGKTQGTIQPNVFTGLEFPHASEHHQEELPRLPPVKLKSEEKQLDINWEEKFEHDGPAAKIITADSTYLIGSFLDVPIGQEINYAGGKKPGGGSWLSVSQGIAEDTSDLVSGFATVGDGLSECVDYPNEYWDSDEYDNDDDVGYMRQPIEDETWFLAHEIDYPSDNEKGTGHGSVHNLQERGPIKDEEDDHLFVEEDSYLSGERYFQSRNVDPLTPSDDPIGLSSTEIYEMTDENNLIAQYDGKLMDEEELNLMRAEPVWQGFVTQTNELIMLGDGKVLDEHGRPRLDDISMDDDQHGSVRSIGVGINSDAADFGREVRESLVGGCSEGDLEYFYDQDDSEKKYIERLKRDKKSSSKYNSDKLVFGNSKSTSTQSKNHIDGGFSYPPPRDGQSKGSAIIRDETDGSLKDEENANRSANSSPSILSNYGYGERDNVRKEEDEEVGGAREEDAAAAEDEEAVAVQEQVKQIKAQEEEFETFDLKIVHRKNRTGFEEDKNFHVVLNSVIAGRYHVTEYLGSAAFSKAIQAHDLHTGMDVCVKIIKNNKDFFDQSLDEIKLLKFVNKHDPGDKCHILRLYDYFYYREHLLIVCELLKANLYEFHKFNRESGGEVYFTMPRLQSITIQCLEALQFLHGLGLIHCDLKPENILVKSYSRCEVKVIDLGSSCFETDHLCLYVQSRSYRAPEVILGLPYDKKIDIWSLGCILAELCTGNVLFQNDSPATLLTRVIGIIGQIEQDMLAKGRDTYKYFTKNHMLYERNQDTARLEYLIPKRTSLRHRLPMGDQGFIDFVAHLLEINPKKRPSASEALKHPWLSYPYEPISS